MKLIKKSMTAGIAAITLAIITANHAIQEVSAETIHNVQAGEYLKIIAEKYAVTVDQLKEWNGLTSDKIYPNTLLIVAQPENTAIVANETFDDTIYTVQSGDYLWKIAQKFDLTVDQLRYWNQLKTDHLFIGQQLIIKSDLTTPEVQQTQPAQTSTNHTYTVVAGDSLWKIANAHKITVTQLKDWNQLKSDRLFIGQQLIVKSDLTTPEAQQTQPAQTSTNHTYTVIAGDSLWKIANAHKITVTQLKDWNQLKSDRLSIGQQLIVKSDLITPEAQQTQPTTDFVYTVKAGDNLWRIARSYKVSITDIRTWNQLKSDLLSIGQQLIIKQKLPVTPTTTNTYIVKAGDNLWRIARNHHLTVEQLRQMNNLNSSLLQIGQVLKIK